MGLMTRRVVVTGMGIIASNGIGQQAFWSALQAGRSGITLLQRFDTSRMPIRVGGEVRDFEVEHYIGRKLAMRTDRMTHFTLAAANEALQDASLQLEKENPQRIGAVIANGAGGIEFVAKQLEAHYTRGPRSMSAFSAIAWLQVANVGQVSIHHGFQGFSKTPVNDTVGGLNALGTAYRAIRRGSADIILAGGSEAQLHPLMLVIMQRQENCAPGDDPTAYRPFDRRANGLILGEGAGICVLEDYEHARERGAQIYGEIIGYSQSNDAYPLTHPLAAQTSSPYYAQALQAALQEAEVSLEQLGYISLDGHATPPADTAEAQALQQVAEEHLAQIPVSVPRTMFGHTFAAAGALDTIAALLALKHGYIPPTINSKDLDPRYGLDLVRDEPRPLRQGTVLLGARGRGGVNAALVIKKQED